MSTSWNRQTAAKSASRASSAANKSTTGTSRRPSVGSKKASGVSAKKPTAAKSAASTNRLTRPQRSTAQNAKRNKAKKREEEWGDSDDQVDPVDDDLGKNTTLTIFSRREFSRHLRRTAHTHAKKLLQSIQKQQAQNSSESEDEDEEESSSSDDDSLISLELPEEPKMPPVRACSGFLFDPIYIPGASPRIGPGQTGCYWPKLVLLARCLKFMINNRSFSSPFFCSWSMRRHDSIAASFR